MKKIKEIILFSEQGDPRKIKTWSNVPYFLTITLESKGIKVHTVDLSIQDSFQKSLRKIYDFISVRLFKSDLISYTRSGIYFYFSNQKIKKAISQYGSADLLLFTTFSQSASKFSTKPSILFCDWTIEHYIGYFLEKRPNYIERLMIDRQKYIIESAASVFVLFPGVTKTMQNKFSNPNIFYLGNVTNNLLNPNPACIEQKSSQKKLVFIGNIKYLNGAYNLLSAFSELKQKHSDLELHIIGFKHADFTNLPKGVFLHGYLDKGEKEAADKYYNLLSNATIFINTTPKWASFSASLEAMCFYTPLIITAYDEFVITFGISINFGYYYNSEFNNLADLIDNILVSKNYKEMCINANSAAKEHSWDVYADRLISNVSSIL